MSILSIMMKISLRISNIVGRTYKVIDKKLSKSQQLTIAKVTYKRPTLRTKRRKLLLKVV